jgi:hypothetical protein
MLQTGVFAEALYRLIEVQRGRLITLARRASRTRESAWDHAVLSVLLIVHWC